jgi:hypothetical protein
MHGAAATLAPVGSSSSPSRRFAVTDRHLVVAADATARIAAVVFKSAQFDLLVSKSVCSIGVEL